MKFSYVWKSIIIAFDNIIDEWILPHGTKFVFCMFSTDTC